jgi:hypothetical protein
MQKPQKNKSFSYLWKNLRSRLSWLDIVFLALAIGFVLIFYLFFRRETTYIVARFKVTDENPLYAKNLPNNEYASSFTVGDSENNELGQASAEIVGVDTYKLTPEDNVVYLDIRIKTTYNPRKKTHVFKGKQVVFGQSFTFSFSNVRAKALVVDFPGYESGLENEEVIVSAQLRDEFREFSDVYGVQPFVAEAIEEGEKVFDSKGNVLAEVLEIRTEPARRWVFSDRGQAVSVRDPELVDVFMKIKFSATRKNNNLFVLDFLPVLIGEEIPLNFNDVFVSATITDIENVDTEYVEN